jgi:hypothetical protein
MQEANMSSFGQCDEKSTSQPRPPLSPDQVIAFALGSHCLRHSAFVSIRTYVVEVMCLRAFEVIDLASFKLADTPVEPEETMLTPNKSILRDAPTSAASLSPTSGSANYLHCIRWFMLT